jgi:hypothetical protein
MPGLPPSKQLPLNSTRFAEHFASLAHNTNQNHLRTHFIPPPEPKP